MLNLSPKSFINAADKWGDTKALQGISLSILSLHVAPFTILSILWSWTYTNLCMDTNKPLHGHKHGAESK